MSGTAYHYWATSTQQTHVNGAYAMADKWNAPQQNLTGLVELFKTLPAEKFPEMSAISYISILALIYAPVIESNLIVTFDCTAL